MRIKHEYKGATIVKRNGKASRGRTVNGYYILMVGQPMRRFAYLDDAKAYVDSKVAA